MLASCTSARGEQAIEQPAETDAATAERERQKREAESLALLKQIAADTAQNAANTKPRPQPTDPYAGWEAWSAAAQGFSALVILFFTWRLVVLNRGLLKETAKSADAAKQSADAMLLINQQWLKTDHWRMGWTEDHIDIHFGIVNPTSMAVTVIYLMLKEISTDAGGYAYESTTARELVPNDVWGLTASRDLTTDDERRLFKDGTLRLIVVGLIGFTDAWGQDKRQPFGALCECGPNRLDVQSLDASVLGRFPGNKHSDPHPE